MAARRGHHRGPAGGRPRGLSARGSVPVGAPGHVPAGRGDPAGLVEHAALGAGEGQRLVGVDLAALQALSPRRGPHHVMTAILVDGHAPFWPRRRAAVASRSWTRVTDRDVPLKTLLRWSETLSGIARTGLGFTESLYEKERFEEILKVAADIRTEADGAERGPRLRRRTGAGVDGHRRQGRPGLRHPQGRRRGRRRQRQGRAAADPARRLGHLALPDRVVRRGLLGGRGRREGGGGGDRHHRRAGAPHRRPRRPAPRLHPRARSTRCSSTAAPWAASWPRTRSRPATSAGSPARRCPSHWWAPIVGASTSSPPSTASGATCSTTACANRCGGANRRRRDLGRGRHVGRRRPRAPRSTAWCPSSPARRRRPAAPLWSGWSATLATALFVAGTTGGSWAC